MNGIPTDPAPVADPAAFDLQAAYARGVNDARYETSVAAYEGYIAGVADTRDSIAAMIRARVADEVEYVWGEWADEDMMRAARRIAAWLRDVDHANLPGDPA